MADPKKTAASIGEAMASFLKESGLDASLRRTSVLAEWAGIVGPQIATVTTPQRITRDGTLFVDVSSPQWMTELSMMEVHLLARINAREGADPVRKIRWGLRR